MSLVGKYPITKKCPFPLVCGTPLKQWRQSIKPYSKVTMVRETPCFQLSLPKSPTTDCISVKENPSTTNEQEDPDGKRVTSELILGEESWEVTQKLHLDLHFPGYSMRAVISCNH